MILVLCTAPAAGDDAIRLARGIVEARLAACVNIIPGLRSVYRWNDQICDDGEVQLLIKTEAARFAALESWIKANHPYQVPEIIALPIEHGSSAYLDWIRAQTS